MSVKAVAAHRRRLGFREVPCGRSSDRAGTPRGRVDCSTLRVARQETMELYCVLGPYLCKQLPQSEPDTFIAHLLKPFPTFNSFKTKFYASIFRISSRLARSLRKIHVNNVHSPNEKRPKTKSLPKSKLKTPLCAIFITDSEFRTPSPRKELKNVGRPEPSGTCSEHVRNTFGTCSGSEPVRKYRNSVRGQLSRSPPKQPESHPKQR